MAFKGLENPITLEYRKGGQDTPTPFPGVPNLGRLWCEHAAACCFFLLFPVTKAVHQNTVFPFVAWPPKAKRPTAYHKIAEAK